MVTIDGSLVHSIIGSLVKVHNMLGETVYQSEINAARKEINVSSFAKGIYTIEVISNSNRVFRKLVVE